MIKSTKSIPTYIPKTDNEFKLWLGKERYFRLMPVPYIKANLSKELKLLKDGTK